MYQSKSNSLKVLLLTILIIILYWISGRYHALYCTPSGFIGLLRVSYQMASPFCLVALTIMTKTTEIYFFIVMGLVGSIFSLIYNILPFNSVNKKCNMTK